MKSVSPKELSLLISLAADGELTGDQAKRLKDYLEAHPEAEQELRRQESLKRILGSRPAINPSPGLWARVAKGIESGKAEEQNLLPFPRRYLPLAVGGAAVVVAGLGVALFLQREAIVSYLSDQSAAVQQAYESGIVKGAIMPLFTDLGNDDILQYALFGTLPLDKESETALRVDEGSADGYRIEVGLAAEQPLPRVTVGDLLRKVQTSRSQASQIDSVLREARERIEQAAFYSENNALAIDPEILRLNRVVLTKIAGVLAPAQRERLDEFLHERNAPYAIAAGEFPGVAPPEIPMAPVERHRSSRDFLVLTPDSFVVMSLGLDIDSIVGSGRQRFRIPDMEQKLEMLIRSRAHRAPSMHAPVVSKHPPVRVTGESDLIKIEMDAGFMEREHESLRVFVRPRPSREKFFRFEFRAGTQGSPGERSLFENEVRADMEIHMDSMMMELRQEQEEQIRQYMLMDSVLRGKARSSRSRGVDSLQ